MRPTGHYRFRWLGRELGWVLESARPVPAHVLHDAALYALPKRRESARGLLPSDKLDEIRHSIAMLEGFISGALPHAVRNRVVGERGDGKGDIVVLSAPHERARIYA